MALRTVSLGATREVFIHPAVKGDPSVTKSPALQGGKYFSSRKVPKIVPFLGDKEAKWAACRPESQITLHLHSAGGSQIRTGLCGWHWRRRCGWRDLTHKWHSVRYSARYLGSERNKSSRYLPIPPFRVFWLKSAMYEYLSIIFFEAPSLLKLEEHLKCHHWDLWL